MESPLGSYSTKSQRWTAIKSRDPAANSAFYYGVTSTLIFCRPTCPARVARRDNIVFFDDVVGARKSGYRSCKRCNPQSVSWHRDMRSKADFDAARLLIERSQEQKEGWTVAEIAEKVGISIGHLHRIFKKYANTTPKEFSSITTKIALPQILSPSDCTYHSLLGAGPSPVHDLECDGPAQCGPQSYGYTSQEHEAFNQILIAGGLLPNAEDTGCTYLGQHESNEEILDPSDTMTIDGVNSWDFWSGTVELAQPADVQSGLAYTALSALTDDQLWWNIRPSHNELY